MSAQQREGTDIVVQGRMVWGSVKIQQELIYGTRSPKMDKNGKPVMIFKFGLAIPKPSSTSSQAEVDNFNKAWTAIHTEASKLGVTWPNDNFAFKFDDGDGKKADGTSYPAHSKGCIVLSCKTNFSLGLSAWEGNDIKQVGEDQIKCGDYIQVAINVRGHGAPNAGLYLNPSMVCRFAYGEAITNAPSPLSVFGAPPAIPAGASQSPVGMMPNAGGMMPQFAQPQAPAMQAPAPVPQQQVFQPNVNVLPPQFQQQAPTAPSAPSFPQFPGQGGN